MKFELGPFVAVRCTVDVAVSDSLKGANGAAAKRKRMFLVDRPRHCSQSQESSSYP